MSSQIAMSPTAILTIPEEIRQEVTGYLSYDDAWSLKKSCTLFYRVVEIPTIKSFLACPYGPSLGMLEEWYIIPDGYETCHYCNKLLPKERFSRFQRRLTAARQYPNSLCFDYGSWRPEKHYCIACGIKNHHYSGGKRIYIGFGDPGFKDEAVVPCEHCGTLLDDGSWDFRFCGVCDGLLGTDDMMSMGLCSPSSSDSPPGLAIRGDENTPKIVMEPERKAYENVHPKSLLASIGERLL